LFGESDGFFDVDPETVRMGGLKSSYNALDGRLPTEMSHIFHRQLKKHQISPMPAQPLYHSYPALTVL
jgi:hypothetical protein